MEGIGTLAGGIAHDLNNILAPIMMSIEVLKLTSTDPRAKNILEIIGVSAKRGADIVRQVLTFARGLEGERVELRFNHLLKDIETIIKDTFPKNIQLELSLPDESWMILGDPTQLHQVLLNLCLNARDAMPNGGSLTIAVENTVLDQQYVAMHIEASAGHYLTINVIDSGTGIPPGILDKIFEPFFTTKEVGEGTGLGLSTVTAIVKGHGGFINVYSQPGQGTIFRVYLPALEPSAIAQKAVPVSSILPRGNGETILVVDDEASICNITRQTLEAFGYRALTANDGAEAVAIYAVHRDEISAVLTDMAMPIMDGPATIRALTKINPAIKIIAASGLNATRYMTKENGGVVKHFLRKPYSAETLLKVIRTILV
jgi:CheY-like chemotaxis protein